MNNLIPAEKIENKIYLIRGQKVMLDRDLAELYGVETKVLNQAVKRNRERFPVDFMFKLTLKEAEELIFHLDADRSRSQIVTLKDAEADFLSVSRQKLKRGKHMKYLPYVFTEHGVLMLSSVLNSKRAVRVNIQIMRSFTRLRQILSSHKELREKIELMERKYDKQFKVVFEYIKSFLKDEGGKEKKIGFLK